MLYVGLVSDNKPKRDSSGEMAILLFLIKLVNHRFLLILWLFSLVQNHRLQVESTIIKEVVVQEQNLSSPVLVLTLSYDVNSAILVDIYTCQHLNIVKSLYDCSFNIQIYIFWFDDLICEMSTRCTLVTFIDRFHSLNFSFIDEVIFTQFLIAFVIHQHKVEISRLSIFIASQCNDKVWEAILVEITISQTALISAWAYLTLFMASQGVRYSCELLVVE